MQVDALFVDFVTGIVRMEAACKRGASGRPVAKGRPPSFCGRKMQKKLILAKTLIDAKLGRVVAPFSICDLLHE